MWRRVLVALLLALVLLPVARADSDVFRDDFVDGAKVSASSGAVFTGTAVTLAAPEVLRKGIVLPLGGPGDFDELNAIPGSVAVENGLFKTWYGGCRSGPVCSIGYATSSNGLVWTKRGVVLSPSGPGEGSVVAYADVIKVGPTYWMWYSATDGANFRIYAATSSDGVAWTRGGVSLDVGASGSGEDYFVWRPAVVFAGSLYRMWYTGNSVSGPHQIFSATSPDGRNWTRKGLAIRAGFQGSPDQVDAAEPSVRIVGGRFEMLYYGTDGSIGRILGANSDDGSVWRKGGVVVDARSPNEYPIVTHPSFLVAGNGSWYVYYGSAGPTWQGHLAIRPPSEGWIQSVPVKIPSGKTWVRFTQSAVVPPDTSVSFTVRDAASREPLRGLENVSLGPIALTSISSVQHPSLILEAWLHGGTGRSPALDAWEVGWMDSSPAENISVGVIPLLLLVLIMIAAVTVAFVIVLKARSRTPPAPPT